MTEPTTGTGLPDIRGYRGLTRVGRGGFSFVYKAEQVSLGRDVAIKILLTDLADEAEVRRFTNECQILGRLGAHRHVVDVYDAGVTDDGRPFIVMKFYGRGSLADRLRASGPLTSQEVISVGIKLATALQAAHDIGVIHRDVKPDNVLIDDNGEPVLTDFGVAAVADAAGRFTSSVAFSHAHVSPEVLDRNAFGAPSDIYSLGSTLYTLLTGRAAFAAETEARQIVSIMTNPVPPIEDPKVPAALSAIIVKAMSKEPGDRYATAGDLATALELIAYPVGTAPDSGDTRIDPYVPQLAKESAPAGESVAGGLAPDVEATRIRPSTRPPVLGFDEVAQPQTPTTDGLEPPVEATVIRASTKDVPAPVAPAAAVNAVEQAAPVAKAVSEPTPIEPVRATAEPKTAPAPAAATAQPVTDSSPEAQLPSAKAEHPKAESSAAAAASAGRAAAVSPQAAAPKPKLGAVPAQAAAPKPSAPSSPQAVPPGGSQSSIPAPLAAKKPAAAAAAAGAPPKKPPVVGPTVVLGGGTPAKKSNAKYFLIAAVALVVLIGASIAVAFSGGSSKSPDATASATAASDTAVVSVPPTYEISVNYANKAIEDRTYAGETPEFALDLCLGDTSLLSSGTRNRIRLLKKSGSKLVSAPAKVTTVKGGRCGASQVNVVLTSTAARPPGSVVDEGYGACTNYRAAIPETSKYAATNVDACVRVAAVSA